MVINRQNIGSLLYAPVNPNVIQEMNSINNFSLNGLNDQFRQYVTDMNHYVNSDAYMQMCYNLASYRDNNLFDIMIYLCTPEDWRLGQKMREYLMANPTIEDLTKRGFLEGCYPMYNNFDNYHQVMNGFSALDKDGEEVYCNYVSSELPELSTIDQLNILDTWENAKNMINNNIDPTSFEE